MKKILTNNLGMKILAILIAVIGWIVIINYDDPTITKSITGIKVSVQNEKSISGQGKCYDIESGSIVDIVIKGKKSVVDTLDSTDFMAVADLAKSSITNAVPVEVSCIRDCDIDIVENKASTMMISIENYITKQFVVSAMLKGNVADGYYISTSEIIISPNRITISGPESVVTTVSSVKCIVDVTGVNSDFSTIGEPYAYTSDNVRINSDELSFSINNISISGKPLYITTVPVEASVSGEAANGYKITDVSSDVEKVSIASSDYSYINSLEKLDVVIDKTDLTEDFEEEISLNDYIQNGAKIISKNKKTNVSVSVRKLDEKELSFKASEVKFSNLPNDIVCNYNNDFEMSVKIRGFGEDIKDISIDELAPSVDAGTLSLGAQYAYISFADIDGVEVMNEVSLPVSLEEKQIVHIDGNTQGENSEDGNHDDDGESSKGNKDNAEAADAADSDTTDNK